MNTRSADTRPASLKSAGSVGGDHPIVVQSMTTPDTNQVEEVISQIHRLEEAGCELVRVTVPKPEDAAVLGEIKRRIRLPLICDIHFDYKMALAALDHPVDKIRINPGNIGGMDRFRQVLRKCRQKGVPMRIGVNAGSLEREFAMKYGFPCPPAMVDRALRYIEIAESEGYRDIIVSLKSSDVMTVVEAFACRPAGGLPDACRRHRGRQAAVCGHQIRMRHRRRLARRHRRHHSHQSFGRPGSRNRGGIRHPASDGRRVRKPELIACPTCGRLAIDLEKIIAELETRLAGRSTPCKISVLGCVVNGPGEPREADIGIAAGNGKGVIFRNGEIVRNVLESEMVDALLEEVELWETEHANGVTAKPASGRRKLPVVTA